MANEKTTIVTGGNRGMGFETCRQLGRLGFKVILCCRDPQAGEQAATKLRDEGSSVEAFRLDLTRAEEIAALVMYTHRIVDADPVLGYVKYRRTVWTQHALGALSQFSGFQDAR
jgi:short-subunit dehydrogenase